MNRANWASGQKHESQIPALANFVVGAGCRDQGAPGTTGPGQPHLNHLLVLIQGIRARLTFSINQGLHTNHAQDQLMFFSIVSNQAELVGDKFHIINLGLWQPISGHQRAECLPTNGENARWIERA